MELRAQLRHATLSIKVLKDTRKEHMLNNPRDSLGREFSQHSY